MSASLEDTGDVGMVSLINLNIIFECSVRELATIHKNSFELDKCSGSADSRYR